MWQAPPRTTPGGQAWHSDAAIELVLVLRLVFHPALRQADGFAASVLRLPGREPRVPDHTTLSRRSRGFAGRQPKVVPHGPLHLVVDGTGPKLFGQGEWDGEKHGRARRSWRKSHLAVDADAGEIVACELTDNAAGRVPVLLGRIEGEIASVAADGAYDGEPMYRSTAGCRHPAACAGGAGRGGRRNAEPARSPPSIRHREGPHGLAVSCTRFRWTPICPARDRYDEVQHGPE